MRADFDILSGPNELIGKYVKLPWDHGCKGDKIHFRNEDTRATLTFDDTMKQWKLSPNQLEQECDAPQWQYVCCDNADRSVPWSQDFTIAGERWQLQILDADLTPKSQVDRLRFKVNRSAWSKKPEDNPMEKGVRKYANAMEDVIELIKRRDTSLHGILPRQGFNITSGPAAARGKYNVNGIAEIDGKQTYLNRKKGATVCFDDTANQWTLRFQHEGVRKKYSSSENADRVVPWSTGGTIEGKHWQSASLSAGYRSNISDEDMAFEVDQIQCACGNYHCDVHARMLHSLNMWYPIWGTQFFDKMDACAQIEQDRLAHKMMTYAFSQPIFRAWDKGRTVHLSNLIRLRAVLAEKIEQNKTLLNKILSFVVSVSIALFNQIFSWMFKSANANDNGGHGLGSYSY